MSNRVCKKCNIPLHSRNSFEWGEANFEFCKSCVEYVSNFKNAIRNDGLGYHEFFTEKFVGYDTDFRNLTIDEIIKIYYEIKSFRDNNHKPVQEPETFTYETHPKYYRLKEKKKYKKLYKYYPYEYVSLFLDELGTAIEYGPSKLYKERYKLDYPSGSRHCYLHIDEEIIDVNKAKSANSKYKSCKNDECLRFLNITENPVENEYCWLCTD